MLAHKPLHLLIEAILTLLIRYSPECRNYTHKHTHTHSHTKRCVIHTVPKPGLQVNSTHAQTYTQTHTHTHTQTHTRPHTHRHTHTELSLSSSLNPIC